MRETPANLQSLHSLEASVRDASLVAVSNDAALADHVQAVHDALDHLTVLLLVPSTPGTREHTLQLLAMRLFNVGACVLKLGLSGYYQVAWQLLRDSLEIVNLVDLFRIDPAALGKWQVADDNTLKREFGPAKVRLALEAHPDFAGQRRDRIYESFSGFAAHASYKGFALLAPGNTPKLGPFMDGKLLRALLEDFGPHFSHAALGIGMLFEDVEIQIIEAKGAFLCKLRKYYAVHVRRTA